MNRILLGCVPLLLELAAFGQDAAPSAQDLAAFESFATDTNSRVIAINQLGRVESPDAAAILSVITVEHRVQNRLMRGVLVGLTRNRTTDIVYVERKFVKRLAESLLEIDELAPGFFARRVGQSSCFGSGMFLNAMREGAHFFRADSCQELDGFTGLRVATRAAEFRFATVDLKRFLGLLASAAAELALSTRYRWYAAA